MNAEKTGEIYCLFMLGGCTVLAYYQFVERTTVGTITGGFLALIAITLYVGMKASGKPKKSNCFVPSSV